MEIEKGDIIQIIDPNNKWFPCLLIVDEVKSWGVQAFVLIPRNDGEPTGRAYYRIEYGKFEQVGSSIMIGAE